METSAARRAGVDVLIAAAASVAGGNLLAFASMPDAAQRVLAVAAGAAVTAIGVVSILRRSPRTTTAADRVTLARAVLAGYCATLTVPILVAGQLPGWLLVAIGAIAFLLDGVDGRVARLTGHVSPEGARMDMEIDAALLLVLSLAAAPQLGWWTLGIGLMRYVFVGASWLRPALGGQMRPSLSRRFIGASQAFALLLALTPAVPEAAGGPVVATALVLLTLSFIRDIVDLERRQRHRLGHSGELLGS